MKLRLLLSFFCLAYCYTSFAFAVTKVTASDAAAFDLFGFSVAIHGDTMVVGAYPSGESVSGPPGTDDASGAAYVFERDEGGPDNWGQVAKLTPDDAEPRDWFGYAVAIDTDRIVVTKIVNTLPGSASGAAYVFERNAVGPDNWGQVAKLNSLDATPGDWFGNSVALSNNTVVVGAYQSDDAGNNSGSAYVFGLDISGNWQQLKKLVSSDAAANDNFGNSVSIDGDTVVIGSYYDTPAGTNSGSAYVFSRDQGGADNWGQVAKLIAADAAAGDEFGWSLDVNSDTIVVGARGDDDVFSVSGSAYVFARDAGGAGNWGQVAKLTAADPSDHAFFGVSVAIDGDVAVVGAHQDDEKGSNSGAAYVFSRDDGGADTWGQVSKLTAADSVAGDQFGRSVAVSNGITVIGAPFDDDNGSSSGSAYVFSFLPASTILDFPDDPDYADGVHPNGGVEGTSLTFKVVYTDPDGVPGILDARIERKDIDGVFQPYDTYPMDPESPNPDYQNGATYTYTLVEGLPSGEYRVFFDFNEGEVVVAGAAFIVDPRPNNPPYTPIDTDLVQYVVNDGVETNISPGQENHIGTNAAENTVYLGATASDPDNNPVLIEVDVRKLSDPGFEVDLPGTVIPSDGFVESGEQASVEFAASPGDFHWRARALDSKGAVSDWIEFGSNDTAITDFDYGFEPHPYGFAFENFSIVDGTLSGSVLDLPGTAFDQINEGDKWSIFRETFDLTSVDTQTQIRAFKDMDLNTDTWPRAVCYGMSILSAMQYRFPDYINVHHTAFRDSLLLFENLVYHLPAPPLVQDDVDGSNLDAKPITKTVLSFHLSQNGSASDQAIRRSITSPTDILNTLRNAFDDVTFNDLYTIRLISPGISGHRVVPYKVENDRIYVYDPNYPSVDHGEEDGPFITVDVNGQGGSGSWEYELWPGEVWSSMNDEIYLVSLDDLYNVGKRPLPFGTSGVENAYSLDGTGTLLLTDDQDRKTGLDEDGVLHKEIPEAEPVYDEAFYPFGENPTWHQKYHLPGDVVLTATVSSKEDGEYSFTKFGGTYFVAVDNVPISEGMSDSMQITSTTAQLDFADNQQEDRTYDFTYNKNNEGQSVTFSAIDIPITPSSIHTYTVDWQVIEQGGEGVTIEIDHEGDGNIDLTVTVGEELNGEDVYRVAIMQLCPCDGPRGTTDPWRNHGKYVSCVAKSAEDFVDRGLITESDKDAIVSAAAQSSCGK